MTTVVWMKRRRSSWTPGQIVLTLIGAAVSVVFLAPFAWGLFTSLKSETEAVEVPPHWLPRDADQPPRRRRD